MSDVTGFLVRANLDDNGTLPRNGTWTGCPDIIPAGTTAMSRNELVTSYNKVINNRLTEGQTNFMYLRAKNMNDAPLTQQCYMFAVPGHLVLHPEIWLSANNMLGPLVKNPLYVPKGPFPEFIVQPGPQVLTAEAQQIVATDAFNWKPETTEHHCLVGVVADSWSAIMNNWPGSNLNDTNAFAQWIYTHGSFGWHNVDINPVTSTVYENQILYVNKDTRDLQVTFTIIANNAPVGARLSFSSGTSTAKGDVLGVDWTPVTAPLGGGKINPDAQVGTARMVEAGFQTIITYRTDFNGLPVPANFSMHMHATIEAAPPQPRNSLMARFMAADSFERSFHRAFSPHALFHGPSGEVHGRGLAGYRTMLAASPFGDDDDDDDLGNEIVVIIGSHTTMPGGS